MVEPSGQIPSPRTLKPKGIADVVVCIDVTGSMQPCIDGDKENVLKLVEGFQANDNLSLDWRVRLIAYRDLNEGERPIINSFTSDVSQFREQLNHLEASGGGDEPESTLDAIFMVTLPLKLYHG